LALRGDFIAPALIFFHLWIVTACRCSHQRIGQMFWIPGFVSPLSFNFVDDHWLLGDFFGIIMLLLAVEIYSINYIDRVSSAPSLHTTRGCRQSTLVGFSQILAFRGRVGWYRPGKRKLRDRRVFLVR
jgi:hypothetical protein